MMAHPTLKAKAQHTATLIFLHGLGDTGHGWLEQLGQIVSPNVKVICPNAPTQPVSLNFGMSMPSWFDIKSLDINAGQDEPGLNKSLQVVKKIIDDEIANKIPHERIIVGGFSQGGSLALYSFLTSQQKFAACIGLSTFLPLHQKFQQLCQPVNKSTPVFLAHGTEDPVVQHMFGLQSKKIMDSYYSSVQFKDYSMGHSSHPKELMDVKKFIEDALK